MKTLEAIWFSLRAFVWRQRVDRELDEELAYHLEREAAWHEARGLSPRDARREAVRHFGGVQRYREECRDVRRTHLLDDARADVHFAIRLLRRDPAFSINVLLISSIGICVCATTVAVVSGILLSPLPFASPDRVTQLALTSPLGPSAAVPLSIYQRIALGTPVTAAISAHEPELGTTKFNGEPERISIERVTPAFFQVFGVAPILGRAFTEAEAAGDTPVALLSDAAWRLRFNAEPRMIGRTLTIDSTSFTIIGVMPPRFRAYFNDEPTVWLPLRLPAAARASPDETVNAVVRLPDGVSLASANAWLAAAFNAKVPSRSASDSVAATAMLQPITEFIYGYMTRPLLILLGAVAMVLLLVSANVATLFLARSTTRSRELDIRRALGATRSREARQLVTEALALTALGGVVGIAATYWTVGLVRGLGSRVLPRVDDIALDWRVLLFAAGAVAIIGVIGGLVPRFATRRHRSPTLDAAGTGERATRGAAVSSTLVVAQIALSVVLVVGAGLLVKGFLRIAPATAGFGLDNRATLSVPLRGTEFAPSNPFGARQFVDAMTARFARVRGVRDVAAALTLPFTGMTWSTTVTVGDGTPLRANQNIITDNYFDVMGIPLRAGRMFTRADGVDGGRVVVINETAAARWWPGQNALGRTMTISRGKDQILVTVVGIVRDARMHGGDTKLRPEVFLSLTQSQPSTVTFVVRTSVAPRSVTAELKRIIWGTLPHVPVGVTDVATIAAAAVSRPRFFSTAMGLFAAMAIALSALAVHGLLAFSVARRRRELGIRIALGASAGRIGRMVLGRALSMGVTGVVIGLLIARAMSRYIESILIETSAADAGIFSASAAGILLLALAAACRPAYRALRTDPVESLKA